MSINIWFVLFCQQKTAYEMRISDWSSDVCSSDLSGLEKERTRLIAADKGAAPGAAPTPKPSGDSVDALHALILHQLDEDQAQEIISIPLAGKSSIADHMVIASGRSTRHVSAIADKLARRIKQEAGPGVRVEGLPNAAVGVIDAGDVIVHLLDRKSTRLNSSH